MENKHLENAREDLRDMFCSNCREYDGMVTDPDTEERYCIYCE